MTKTARLFFIYTLYFILALAAYVMFYLYIENKSVNTSNVLGEIIVIQEQNAQMQKLDDTIAETAEGRKKLTSFFVDSNQIIEFLETIEGLGAIAGIEIDVKSISETETDAENIKNLNLSIDFEGQWSNVHHFLVLLESIPIQMTTKRLNIRERALEESGQVLWDGNVEFKTLQLDS